MATIVIRKDDSLETVRKKLRLRFKLRKAFNPQRYLGKWKTEEDPLLYQKRVRKEWNEHTD